jgi:DNA-binding CsgD family transcriptional regulator
MTLGIPERCLQMWSEAGLNEQLARARGVEEAARIVRRAAAALGVRDCRIVRRAERGGERCSALEFPVLGPLGVVATLVCGETPLTRERERELVIIAMHLSVWWTNRGIDGAAENDALTPRQLEIAQLATIGRTNAAIATALGISINTVKARLKEVFERLRVDNRTELANALRTRLVAGGSAD